MSKQARSDDNADFSPVYYYNCKHGPSNSPCEEGCHGLHQPIMPNDWMKDYEPPTEGLVDASSVGGGDE